MIVTDERAPRWIRELARFQRIKNLLFLHGNVMDLVSFPDEREGKTEWIDGYSIGAFLQRFLFDRGYEVVGVFDPLDGLTFLTPDMRKTYERLRDGKELEPCEHNATSKAGPTWQSAPNAPPDTPPAPSGPPQKKAEDTLLAVAGMARAIANTHTPCAFVVNLASRLIASPGYPSEREHTVLAQLLKGSLQGASSYSHDRGREWSNLIALVCDKLNDFPPFLYVDNPRARGIHVEKPDRTARQRFFRENYPMFHGVDPSAKPTDALVAQFDFLTDGLTNYELHSLVTLSRDEALVVQPLEALVSRYKYGISRSEWDSPELRERLKQADTLIRGRIKGQDIAVARVQDLIKRAALGLAAGVTGKSHRPRGVLFFAGPTGVGKTEMAKALAEILFGNEERLIRFDMSEYSAEHADQRLLGSPPGYVGYEEGGQLTNQVKERPFSVLLFDEIDKAHPRIFDKFLQILDDGRLTDGKGDTVYFSESVIIFTSNMGTVDLGQSADPVSGTNLAQTLVYGEMPYEQVRETILGAIARHFTEKLGRPEILNRFGDNFVVFDFIRPPLHAEIAADLVTRFCTAIQEERKIAVAVAAGAITTLTQFAEANLAQGGRGIRNVIDRALIDPLARWLFDHGQAVERITIESVTDNGLDAPYRYTLDVRVPTTQNPT